MYDCLLTKMESQAGKLGRLADAQNNTTMNIRTDNTTNPTTRTLKKIAKTLDFPVIGSQ